MAKSGKGLFQTATSQPFAPAVEPRGVAVGRRLLALALLAIIFLCLYELFRGLSLFNPGYGPVDHIFAVLLLLSELFIALHSFGYFWSIVRTARNVNSAHTVVFTDYSTVPVALYLATYNEPADIVEDTLNSVTGLDYPNLTIYLNCDSQKAEQAARVQALAEKYSVNFYHRVPNKGYKAGGINLFIERLGHDLPAAKYLVVLDADSKPVRTFVSELVALAEQNTRLAFVQSPQHYANTADSLVALGASSQQSVFYEYICDAKSVSGAMFCCGTNVLFRVEALLSVEGFDETSVTEDFATSLRLHTTGWLSHYHNNVYVEGVGPETLGAYFVQQSRWALGTLGFFLQRILPTILFRPGSLTLGQKWEYLLSGTYYFTGLTQVVLLSSPVAFLLFGVKPLIADPLVYLAVYIPPFIFSNFLFYFTMKRRHYPIKHILVGQALNFITFWVFVRAAYSAILNQRKAFANTPKGDGARLPWIILWPQLLLVFLSILSSIVGLRRWWLDQDPTVLLNVFWAIYHTLLIGTVFLFNRNVVLGRPERFFADYH